MSSQKNFEYLLILLELNDVDVDWSSLSSSVVMQTSFSTCLYVQFCCVKEYTGSIKRRKLSLLFHKIVPLRIDTFFLQRLHRKNTKLPSTLGLLNTLLQFVHVWLVSRILVSCKTLSGILNLRFYPATSQCLCEGFLKKYSLSNINICNKNILFLL